jgi:hypothetical protein
MGGLDTEVYGRLADRHETMSMNQVEREAGIVGVQLFDDTPHYSIRHRLIDLLHQPGNLCVPLDVSHNSKKFDHGARSIGRCGV